jgi:hypothetical protein
VLSVGARLVSTTCTTEVMVVRAADPNLVVECGGRPMAAKGDAIERVPPRNGFDTGTELGKRYGSADDRLELLCVKAGAGSLSVEDEILSIRSPKPLPSSD